MTLDDKGEKTLIAQAVNQLHGLQRPNTCPNPECQHAYPVHLWVCPDCGTPHPRKVQLEKEAKKKGAPA